MTSKDLYLEKIKKHVTFDYVEFRHDSTMLKQALYCTHCSVIFEFSILKRCKMLEGRSQMCNKAKNKNVIRTYGRERIDSAVRGKRGF